MLAAEQASADADGRKLSEPARGGVERCVKCLVACGRETLLKRQACGGGGLGEHLGIVEVEAATKSEPCRGERKAGAGAELGCARGGPERDRRGSRESLWPHERQPQLSGTAFCLDTEASNLRMAGWLTGRWDPIHLAEQTLDSLSGEVRVGTREIEEERGRSSQAPAGSVCESFGEAD